MAVTGGILSEQQPAGVTVAEDRAASILAVTSELPWPLNTGGHLRTFHLLRALAQRFRVRLVSATRPGQESSIDPLRQVGIAVCPAKVGPRVVWKEGLRAAAAAVLREPYVLYRRHDWSAVRAELKRQIAVEPPDLLYLDHLDSLVYADRRSRTPTLIDLHNVYSTLAHRVATEQIAWWRRRYLSRESKLLALMERRAALRADQLFAVSDDERMYFEELGARAVEVVPNGVDCQAFSALPTGRGGQPPLILYLGNMSWGPNIGAAAFLAREVLPRLRGRFPEACLRIVGAPRVRRRGLCPTYRVSRCSATFQTSSPTSHRPNCSRYRSIPGAVRGSRFWRRSPPGSPWLARRSGARDWGSAMGNT